MSSRRKCVYNPEWESNAVYQTWIRPFKADKTKAICSVCDKIIDISNMGEAALKSHTKAEKHNRSLNSAASNNPLKISAFFKPPSAKSSPKSDVNTIDVPVMSVPPPPNNMPSTSGSTGTLSQFISKEDVLRAEILWTMHTVSSHLSYSSNEKVKRVFQAMFPDSQIAAKFSCGDRKTAYLCVFGIGEYLKELLVTDIKGPYCVLFDESLNKKIQLKQMDIHVRYWKRNAVVSRYIGSQFLGHGTALDMLGHFQKGVLDSGMDISQMVQVSMDGPNVNWSFYDMLKTKLFEEYNTKLINIGSCGLHILHNSFKAGVTDAKWDVSSLLSSLYYLFKDSPARREDFQTISQNTIMPLKFVGHRWLENAPVCERAIGIWDNVEKYVQAVKEKKVTPPENKSYSVISSAVEDPLIIAKLHFFKCIASQLQPFLKDFQTDKPMVSFLYQSLCDIIRGLMRRFVKESVLSEANTGEKLVSIDYQDKGNHLVYKHVDIGFSAEKAVKDAQKKCEKKGRNLSDRMVMDFKEECKVFLIAILKKLLLKCPVIYSLVRYMSCLNPKEMVANQRQCSNRFKQILTVLLNAKRVQESECDVILQQYTAFLDTIPVIGSATFSGFSYTEQRLDEFYFNYMSGPECSKLFDVVKLLLVLSHGQASVERGFSVNKEVEVENLKMRSIVAQRLICDHVNSVGGVMNVDINPKLLMSASAARTKYEAYLNDEKVKRQTEQEQRKRKDVMDSVDKLKEQRKRLKTDIDSLIKSADDLSEKAEVTGNLTFISKANSFRRTSKEKQVQLEGLETEISDKLSSLKQL